MSMINFNLGSYPAVLQGTLTFSGTVGALVPGEWAYIGASLVAATFKGVVVKVNSTAKTVVLKKITGTPVAGQTLTGNTSAATAATIAAITAVDTSSTNPIAYNKGGWNLRETEHGIVRSKKLNAGGTRYAVEVLHAQQSMLTTRTDFGTVPTYTLTGGAWSTATTYDVSNGDAVTFTIISNEPVRLPAGTTYAFTITTSGDVLVASRAGTLSASSSDLLTHTFSYPVVAGDVVTGGKLKITTGNFNLNGGTAYEVADNGSSKALSGNQAVAGSLADKTGVTIQS